MPDADAAIVAARKRATDLGGRMCIAIVDSGASLKAFTRGNDAWAAVYIVIQKAKTAVCFGMPTEQAAAAGGSLFASNIPARPDYFSRRLPIVGKESVLIGATGVSKRLERRLIPVKCHVPLQPWLGSTLIGDE